MEVIKKNVIFKFSEEDIKAIKRVYGIVNEMGDVMDDIAGNWSEITLNGKTYQTDDLNNGIWEFLKSLSLQVSSNNEIPIIVNKWK